jgi:hypothetical protein
MKPTVSRPANDTRCKRVSGRWIVVLKNGVHVKVERFDTEAEAHSFRQHMLNSKEVEPA